eukprot:scaffold44086_cov63-Phaeocystis_antarctica.AAC.5
MAEVIAVVHVPPAKMRLGLICLHLPLQCEVGSVAIGWVAPFGRVQGSAEAHLNSSPKTRPVNADLHESTHKYERSKGVPLIISRAIKN